VLGNETLSFRIEPRFWTVIVVAWAAGVQRITTPNTASDSTRIFGFIEPSPIKRPHLGSEITAFDL
jgi:hypothetical protein